MGENKHNKNRIDIVRGDTIYNMFSVFVITVTSLQVFYPTADTNMSPADQVIILEEDLQIAPDFFEYFLALVPLLHSDDSLLGVKELNIYMFYLQFLYLVIFVQII